ncbi:hypothetical protein [Roseovarius sp. M141]|uniref:hypothetical protein n=1 Tax=Roseovarius sp. M141 TaxID=2583806 RepID=UPI0020CD4B0A|nr:hypothetical protein [Roseovarius sp. M141]MCQ0092229.1 oxidase [Roseovarius sp. M141]
MKKHYFDAGLFVAASTGRLARCLIWCCLPAALFYVVSLLVMIGSGFSAVEALRDLAQQTGQSSFLGFLSSIGTWLWVSAAAICLFSARLDVAGRGGAHVTLLRLLGWFSLVLAVDDFFLIHDRYITEGILLPLYAIFILVVARRYWSLIRAIDKPAFLMTGGLLAGSIAVDAVQEILPIPYGVSQALEEGFKFVGAAAWMYFCVRIAGHGLTSVSDRGA